MSGPFIYEWDGDAMVPLPRFAKSCDEAFVVHEHYRLDAIDERSQKSHNHFFAQLHDTWKTLPDAASERFQVEDHFRKHLLIKAGYYNLRTYVASSQAEAQRVARWSRRQDEYSIVTIDGCVVNEFTAKSQAKSAMKSKEFQDAKTKVLDLAADMIGVTRNELDKARAA